MALFALVCVIWGSVLAAGENDHKNLCRKNEFWNADVSLCFSCSTCKDYPKTPSCNLCKMTEESPDPWRFAAIVSLSVLGVLLVCGLLLVAVIVHLYRSRRKRTLREPIEETTGPLY